MSGRRTHTLPTRSLYFGVCVCVCVCNAQIMLSTNHAHADILNGIKYYLLWHGACIHHRSICTLKLWPGVLGLSFSLYGGTSGTWFTYIPPRALRGYGIKVLPVPSSFTSVREVRVWGACPFGWWISQVSFFIIPYLSDMGKKKKFMTQFCSF